MQIVHSVFLFFELNLIFLFNLSSLTKPQNPNLILFFDREKNHVQLKRIRLNIEVHSLLLRLNENK